MNNQVTYSIKKNFETIPFIEIILPYTENFLNSFELELSGSVKDKLHGKLLEELSSLAEVTLQQELDFFIKEGNNQIGCYVEKMNSSLAEDFPVLDRLIRLKTINFSKHIYNVIYRFNKDRKSIISVFNLNEVKIVDIDANLGDGHNGEGTTLVYLSNDTKIIYKPRNVSITNSYNSFIYWVNHKLKIDLKTFQVLDCGDYGWLEFVNNEEVNSQDNLQEYYFKAGALLSVAFLLGSKDCHRENVIASSKNPVIIDHETIIQPFLSNQSILSWDEQNKIPHFSVLENALIVNKDTGVPMAFAGYGVKDNLQVTELEKKVVKPNTIDSKRATRFVVRQLVENNIPKHRDKYIFANDYSKNFIEGFSETYDLFLNSKKELKSCGSPIEVFKNKEVRYVWRPTFVYFKILKYMRSATLMSGFETYNSKLHELLSKAYAGENMKDYKFILDFEMKQMLNGDIPIFSLNSLDNFLEGNNSFKIFDRNCLDNIYHRIDLLSEEHKKEQLEYIGRWFKI